MKFTGVVRRRIPRNDTQTKNRLSNKETWNLETGLDLEGIGIREAKEEDLEVFRLIKGKGPIYANLAALRMIARAYGTPVRRVLKNSREQ